MSIDRLLLDAAMQAVAVAVGIYGYRFLNSFGKLLWWQVFISLINYIIRTAITPQEWIGAQFNFYMILEPTLLLMAAHYYGLRWHKYLLYALIVLSWGAVLLQVGVIGVQKFANYASAFQCVIFVCVYVTLMYQSIINIKSQKDALLTLLISLGITLFFACYIPYVTMIHYLQDSNPLLNTRLFEILVINIFSNLRYLLLAIGLLMMIGINRKEKQLHFA